MSAEIVTFIPQAHLTAQENLDNFNEMARAHLKVFGADFDFDSDNWDVSDTVSRKGTDTKKNVVFSDWDTAGTRASKSAPMPEPFKTFAKSCFRYKYGLKPTKDIAARVAALRVLCAALVERGQTNPIHLNGSVFDRAAARLPERFSPSAWYKHGNELKAIADFLRENRLSIVPVYWKSPYERPIDNHVGKVGDDFDRRRAEKMPSPHALDALARIFRTSEHPTDQAITSVCALMVTHPERGSETMNIRVDCEVERSPDGKEQYGLRWWPAKGGEPTVKPIIPAAVDLVKTALARLRKLTEKGRALAKWYTENPNKIYLPKELEHLRGRGMLSMDEVALIIFDDDWVADTPLDARAQGNNWCKHNGVPLFKGERPDRGRYARFSDVELAVVGGLKVKAIKGKIQLDDDGKPIMEWHDGMLPRGFPTAEPEQGLFYKDMLLLFPINHFFERKGTYRCMFERKDLNWLNNHLGRQNVADSVSVFERNSLTEPDGTHIDIHTHMFRHYLNTLAEMGGMNELDLARWSGRANVSQNAAYQHMSSGEIIERTENLLGAPAGDFASEKNSTEPSTGSISGSSKGAIVLNPGYDLSVLTDRELKLVVQAQYRALRITAGHTTMVGYCEHDFAMEPCLKHEDCVNCNEKFCVKGDLVREANLRAMRDETMMLLERAEQAKKEEYYGADKWIEHQKKTLANIDALLSMIDNPFVKLGAVIRITSHKAANRIIHQPDNVDEVRSLMDASSDEGMSASPAEYEDGSDLDDDDDEYLPMSGFVLEV